MTATGLGEAAEQLRRATVVVQGAGRRHGCGSGVIWSPEGVIVTNAHVASRSEANIELWDGRQFAATVTARDSRKDLAALKVEASDLPAARPRDSREVRVGEIAIAVGNPLGFVGAMTTGVVHTVGPLSGLSRRNWVQADVRLAPGNSGGPLADAQGRVMGINTMVAGGLALAIPSNTVSDLLRGAASGVSLGVTVRPVRLNVDRRPALGLLILEVEPGSPAATASLLAGDLLIGAEGHRFRSVEDLSQALHAGGEVVRLQFLRGDRTREREVAVRLRHRASEAA